MIMTKLKLEFLSSKGRNESERDIFIDQKPGNRDGILFHEKLKEKQRHSP